MSSKGLTVTNGANAKWKTRNHTLRSKLTMLRSGSNFACKVMDETADKDRSRFNFIVKAIVDLENSYSGALK